MSVSKSYSVSLVLPLGRSLDCGKAPGLRGLLVVSLIFLYRVSFGGMFGISGKYRFSHIRVIA